MKRTINVHTGEIMTGCDEVVLNSNTNKSCFLIAAYDSKRKIGAMAHAIYQDESEVVELHPKIAKDAPHAIDEMIKDMRLLGSKIEDIEVKLVTGENVPHTHNDPHYVNRLKNIIGLLDEKKIKHTKEIAVDVGAQHVLLDVETGKLIFK